MKVIFLEPTRRHKKDKRRSVAEVAKRLENKYVVTATFLRANKSKIANFIIQNASKTAINDYIAEQYITGNWKNWILGEKHGIHTKAAEKRGGVSFFDTGDYYKSMQVKTEFTPAEQKALKILKKFKKR